MTDSQTRDIKPGRYVYDVLLTDPNQEKFRVVEGQVLVREMRLLGVNSNGRIFTFQRWRCKRN